MAADSQPGVHFMWEFRCWLKLPCPFKKKQKNTHTGSEYAVLKRHCLIWTMPRTKELSEDRRSRIAGMHEADKDYKSISKRLDVRVSTAQNAQCGEEESWRVS